MSRTLPIALAALGAVALAACDQGAEPEEAAEPAETEEPDADEPEPESPDGYAEAPMLAELVEAGDLPPVDERLPAEPMVVEPVERVGDYGGAWNTTILGAGDTAWLFRTVGYEQLTRLSPDGSDILPNLAQEIETNDDASEYTFHLYEDVKWSDGEAFTAHDIEFWYNDVATHPELGGEPPAWMITGEQPGEVEALDDHTVVFRFPGGPHGLLLERLATSLGTGVTAHPQHYLSQFHVDHNPDVQDLADEFGHPDWVALFDDRTGVGSNFDPELPTLRAWQMTNRFGDSASLVFERNPYYWKVDTAGNQLPYLDQVIFEVIEDREVMVLRALAGEIDMQDRHIADQANRPLFADHAEDGDYRFFETTPIQMNDGMIALNLSHKDPVLREVFQNRDFRIGLSHAINRQEIIDVIYQSQGEPYQGAPRPESEYYHEQLAKQYTEYDVDLANEYLDRAFPERDAQGFRLGPDGNRITFQIDMPLGGGQREAALVDVLEFVERDWAEVGVDMSINSMDRSLSNIRRDDNDHDALIWTGFGGGLHTVVLDPRWYFPYSNESNWAVAWGHWFQGDPRGEEPPEVPRQQMELYRQLISTGDPDEQYELMMEILDIAAEEFWGIGINLTPDGYGIVKNHFRNVPEWMPDAWPFPTPASTNPEQYFIEQ